MARAPRVNLDKKQNRSNAHLKSREENTPVFESQDFTPPDNLTKKELEVWRWLVGVFKATVNCRVSDADVHLMELYCRAKVATDEADAELKKDPRPHVLVDTGMTNRDGEIKYQIKPNPNIKKRTENAQLCIKLFDQLGLSPLARARAGLKAANAQADMDVFKELMNRSDD